MKREIAVDGSDWFQEEFQGNDAANSHDAEKCYDL